MSKPAKTAPQGGTIALNRRARHDYALEERFEAGIALEGWEVKSLRAGKAQLVDAYVLLKEGEAFLLGALITPLGTASTHITPDPTRTFEQTGTTTAMTAALVLAGLAAVVVLFRR